MSPKLLPLVAALALSASAHAVTVNMTDFNFGTPVSASISGTNGSPSYDGPSGAFKGTLTTDTASSAQRGSITGQSSTSFVAWCAELTQSFSFGVSYDYSQVTGAGYFGAQRANDLSRLFTAAATNHFVFDSNGSAAFQAGIWEIIYEQNPGYDFLAGTLKAAPDNPEDAGAVAAFNTVESFLTHLGQYGTSYQISVLANPDHQDFLVATIPEPETWALLVGGLGAIGLVRRRKKA
jgi:hypothetical protein